MPKATARLPIWRQFALLLRLQFSDYRESAVSFGSTNFAINRVGLLRLMKQIDFSAMLPVHKSAFVVTLFLLNQLSALPGLTVSLLVGHLWLGIPLHAILIAVPIALLASASLTVVGGFVRTNGQLNLYSSMVYFVVMFLSPVLIPVERLPLILRKTAYLLQPGQAAMAIRDAIAGQFGLHFWAMVGALCLWLVVAGYVGLRNLDWRKD